MGFDRVPLSPLPVRDAGKDRDAGVMRKLPGAGFQEVYGAPGTRKRAAPRECRALRLNSNMTSCDVR